MTLPEYLKEHSIDQTTADKFGLTEITDKTHGLQMVIPVKDDKGKLLFKKYRNLDRSDTNKIPKYTFDPGSHETTFNQEIIQSNPTLIIFEGEIDVIRASQDHLPGISGTNGAMSIPDNWPELLKGKELYICYDTDPTGIKAIYKLGALFPKIKVVEIPHPHKDFSDYITANTKQDFIELLKVAKPFPEWTVANPKEEYKTLTVAELYTKEFPQEAWIIDKILPTQGIVMFSGDSGVGKSWLALEIVRALTNNDIFLDHFEIKTQNVPILIIDKENGLRRLQQRMKSLGVPATENVYLLQYPEKFSLEDQDFMQAVQNLIQVKNIGIIILDSFIDILVGSENASPDTQAVFNALRSIATEVVWVPLHHEVKPVARFQPLAGDRARGSGNIKAQVDYLFSLQRTKTAKTIHIEQGKARDYEQLPKFAVEFITLETTGEMGGFKYLGEVKDETSKVEEAANFIMDFLGFNPESTRQTIIDKGEDSGITKTAVERGLAQLKEKKLLQIKLDPIKKSRKLFSLVTIVDVDTDNSEGVITEDMGFINELAGSEE